MNPAEGRNRVVIEGVTPQINCGAYPVKRTVGERVVVEADIFADGHDALRCLVLFRREDESSWTEAAMEPGYNDHWRGEFRIASLGTYRCTIVAWIDRFLTWRRDFEKRVKAEQDVSVDLLIGAELIQASAQGTSGSDKARLTEWVKLLRGEGAKRNLQRILDDDELTELMERHGGREFSTAYERELVVVVDRERARFSTWYEMFPRSTAKEPGRHGTFRDCEERLPYIARMGFDVLYLPPIHPIGRVHRKGRNNAPNAEPGDAGSPWAIGSDEGGHKSIQPELGTLADFRRLVANAKEHGIEIALDIAFQCAPDHPYVKQHPEWFRKRPDGTVQYAENPPKKYEDIYPFNFDSPAWWELWQELKSIFVYWIEQGVRIFRVDNPHTKPFAFWQWCIAEIKSQYPDVIFLAEAFTRPRIMYRLAKLGFTQSYTYFAWRNTRYELTEYFTELAQTEVAEYFRGNLWPNTPDILTDVLQAGGRPAFMLRLTLAATLGASYGIYGPAFEHCEHRPRHHGSEEYLDSEKYEVRHHDLDRSDGLAEFIARVNAIRRENPALQSDRRLRFHPVDNGALLCYSKSTDDLSNVIIVVANLDPYHTQAGFVELPLGDLRLDEDQAYQAHDLLTGARYLWQGSRNYVELNPHVSAAHVFRVRRRSRTEQDFEYYL